MPRGGGHTAWHLSRAGGGARDVVVAAVPAATPSRSPVASAAPSRPVPSRASARHDPAPAPPRVPAGPPTTRATTHAARPVTRSPRPEVREYGAFTCTRRFTLDWGNSVVAAPCQATGPKVQFKGELTAAGGGTATVTVSLRSGGRTVAGPYTCTALAFRGDAETRACGPRESGARKGRTYVVQMNWAYTRNGRTLRGSVQGSPFTF